MNVVNHYTHITHKYNTKKNFQVFSSKFCILDFKWPMFSKVVKLVTKKNY